MKEIWDKYFLHIIYCITLVIICITWYHLTNPKKSTQQQVNIDTIKVKKDSLNNIINKLHQDEKEEIITIRNANNDSTLIIFKRLVSE